MLEFGVVFDNQDRSELENKKCFIFIYFWKTKWSALNTRISAGIDSN